MFGWFKKKKKKDEPKWERPYIPGVDSPKYTHTPTGAKLRSEEPRRSETYYIPFDSPPTPQPDTSIFDSSPCDTSSSSSYDSGCDSSSSSWDSGSSGCDSSSSSWDSGSSGDCGGGSFGGSD